MESEIRKMLHSYFEAFEKKDWGTLRELCSDDYIFINADRDRKMRLEKVIEVNHEHCFNAKFTLSNIKIGISSDGEMAWASYHLYNETLWNGVPMVTTGVSTTTLEKRNSRWVITLDHFARPWSDVGHIDLGKYQQNICEYYYKEALDLRRSWINYCKELLAGHDVLEVACGEGSITRLITETAKSVLATDGSEKILDIARSYAHPRGNVTYQKANTYSLKGVTGTYSAGFHAFWFSHIPLSRRDEFLKGFHSKLQPGALVVFGDGFWGGIHLDDAGNSYDIHRLRDGTEYEIIKNYPTEEELRDMLKEAASDIEYRRFGLVWVISYRLK